MPYIKSGPVLGLLAISPFRIKSWSKGFLRAMDHQLYVGKANADMGLLWDQILSLDGSDLTKKVSS